MQHDENKLAHTHEHRHENDIQITNRKMKEIRQNKYEKCYSAIKRESVTDQQIPCKWQLQLNPAKINSTLTQTI